MVLLDRQVMVKPHKFIWPQDPEDENPLFDTELEFGKQRPAIPLQLELYPLEATRPPNAYTTVIEESKHLTYTAELNKIEPVSFHLGIADERDQTPDSPLKNSESDFPSEREPLLESRAFHSYPFDFSTARIVRKNLYNIEHNPSKVLIPLQFELINLDCFKLTNYPPFSLEEQLQGRRFLVVSKSEDQNKISLSFSVGDIDPKVNCREDQLIISLLSRRVNTATFENWDLNRHNHNEANDIWCEKHFITLVEFLKIMEFSIGNKFAPRSGDHGEESKEGFDAYEKKRIRSNIREFLTGKTLSSSLPQHILDPMLPSQKDFVFGMYRQINQYSHRRPAFSYKTVALMKLEDVEKSITKCTQFLSFEVSLE